MASSLISSSHHVEFDSMFGMDDATLVQIFESLIATGLKEFLGCPAVFYEAALTEFFTSGSVREYGMVVSTIRGTTVEISESMFAKAFELLTEGLTDLSDVPKNLVFDARSLFSKSKEQKRKRRLVLSADDETVEEQPASEVESTVEKQPAVTVAPATGVQDPVDENVERVDEPVPESVEQPAVTPVVEAATDDPDAIIEQVLDQLDSVAANQDSGDQPTATIDETIPWYDLPFEFAIRDSERLFETGSDTEDDMDLDEGNQEFPMGSGTDVVVGTDVGNQQEQSLDANISRTDAEDYLVEESDEELVPETEKPSADEAMSLEDILMTIPVEVSLPSASVEITRITLGKEIHIPSVTERTWYLAGLPQIPVDDKGKEPLLQKDPVKGNPVQEQILLIVVDVECLVQLREKGVQMTTLLATCTWLQPELQERRLFTVDGGRTVNQPEQVRRAAHGGGGVRLEERRGAEAMMLGLGFVV
ncbi:hypothetical protein F511_21015 [Dorcoceras hygrometricum]|uniref:Uncharacterized protein n=1 Tax=Dorcoceras hygrometricum TaxID=472368 RepID=A0A2Z7ASJ2_9LAMI|nr:hypothetical protein F511_21015 [Dorcoceras hygrometricum]